MVLMYLMAMDTYVPLYLMDRNMILNRSLTHRGVGPPACYSGEAVRSCSVTITVLYLTLSTGASGEQSDPLVSGARRPPSPRRPLGDRSETVIREYGSRLMVRTPGRQYETPAG